MEDTLFIIIMRIECQGIISAKEWMVPGSQASHESKIQAMIARREKKQALLTRAA